jgi:hypothetical protein
MVINVTEVSMERSGITNNYDPEQARPQLPTELVQIYEPLTEQDWSYSHHPSITWFKGKFYAIWSNGRVHEDDLGQRVLMSTSEDFYHWTKPAPLVDSLMGNSSELVLTAAGFHQHEGTLVAYFGQYEYVQDNVRDGTFVRIGTGHMDTRLRAVTTMDGEHWSEPLEMHVPIVPNHGPQRTASGRLIISGNVMFPYTEDPAGLTGWQTAGIYDPDRHDQIWDDSEFFQTVAQTMGWPVKLCEGSFYESDDHVLHMLLRSGTEKLWVAESSDDGASWSTPRETEFTDNVTKFHFGRLPDGRFYYVGCPDPQPKGARNPLVLSISEDGMRFDRHFILGNTRFEKRFEGRHKGGVYGYPHSMIHEGYLYVVFSIWKEGLAVIRTNLAEL